MPDPRDPALGRVRTGRVGTIDESFQWALAVAAFAEILKGSPYGDPAELNAIEQLVVRPVHEDFPDRAEFVTLFAQARDLLE